TQPPRNGRSYLDTLRERVRPQFRERIEFTGRLDRATGVIGYLRRAQICCLPSHMETFGIAAVEAMAVGKPVIYSRTGPGPEIIEDGVTGLLCNPFDPADIAAKILRLLENPAWARQLGNAARARVLEHFDRQRWAERNVAFYRECLGAARSALPPTPTQG
ncbi:MAG: glycosyltransferase family 4 protein, partial [Verrucomicrobiales bacterium]|nr:glycosyltransferase family 4 protein [Verrucomicrobiales bacterium]